ncbi:MAG: sulfatase-like hydrolase/transferase, partial [Opitutales bacterium]|nr:sulfatase-like hydrolase/transferase [Opitutales bacterium]
MKTIFLFLTLFVPVMTVHLFGASRPNVVIILADDLGIGDVSAYNEDSAWETPNIDKLAASGMSFSDAHTGAALCTPTRYGILTGRYAWRTTLKSAGYNGYSSPLIEDERFTIAELFKGEGYQTAIVGKWHVGWNWQLKGSQMETFDDRTVPVIDFSQPIKNGPESQGFIYSYGTLASLSSPPFVWVENSMPTAIPSDISVNYDEKAFWRKGPKADNFDHVEVLGDITDRSIEYIGEQSGTDDPFFLYVAMTAP